MEINGLRHPGGAEQLPGLPVRKGDASTDPAFAALLAMLLGDGGMTVAAAAAPGPVAGGGMEREGSAAVPAAVGGVEARPATVEEMLAALRVEAGPAPDLKPTVAAPAQPELTPPELIPPELTQPELIPPELTSPLALALPQPSLPAAEAPPAEPPALPPAPPLTPDQFADTIARTVVRSGPGRYNLTLRLHPEHLGEVTLQVLLDGQEVRTVMQVAHPSAQEALEAQADRLRAGLSQAGLTLASFHVSIGNGGQSPRDPRARERTPDLARPARRISPATLPPIPASQPLPDPRRSGRLDTIA